MVLLLRMINVSLFKIIVKIIIIYIRMFKNKNKKEKGLRYAPLMILLRMNKRKNQMLIAWEKSQDLIRKWMTQLRKKAKKVETFHLDTIRIEMDCILKGNQQQPKKIWLFIHLIHQIKTISITLSSSPSGFLLLKDPLLRRMTNKFLRTNKGM